MGYKISQNSLIEKNYLIVDSGGVEYYENSFLGGKKRVQFSEIECVLMSGSNVLSLQRGGKTFSIKTDPNNAKHQALITALVQEVRRTAPPPI